MRKKRIIWICMGFLLTACANTNTLQPADKENLPPIEERACGSLNDGAETEKLRSAGDTSVLELSFNQEKERQMPRTTTMPVLMAAPAVPTTASHELTDMAFADPWFEQTIEPIPADAEWVPDISGDTETWIEPAVPAYNGAVLSARLGTVQGPSGKETYYNLPMGGVIQIMRGIGNWDDYWIREDGVKMLGSYVMVAADLNLHPRGSLVETSLGTGIVCDTGTFIYSNPYQIDIATAW